MGQSKSVKSSMTMKIVHGDSEMQKRFGLKMMMKFGLKTALNINFSRCLMLSISPFYLVKI